MGSQVNYLEGCTAPQYDSNQLHAAIVELIALNNSTIKYSTVQNWYSGDQKGQGGIYNFVTKRGLCVGHSSKISWTQVETGSSITWKYPSCLLVGEDAKGEFYSVALTNNYQQADTGTKMTHIGKNTRSRIVSKGISAGNSKNTYRGFVSVNKKAIGARNYSQCDSLLIGNLSNSNTFPFISVQNCTTKIEHEASTSKIGEEQIFYFLQRGISIEKGIELMISGFCREVFTELPLEFASEADRFIKFKIRRKCRIMNLKSPILEIKDLRASTNNNEILKSLNLTINRGEIHAIMGPNGSGKSTFSKIIAGHPTYEVLSGDILFKGFSILDLDPEERSHLGIFLAFQYPIEIPGVSNEDFLRLAYNSKQKFLEKPEVDPIEFFSIINEKLKSVNMSSVFLSRNVNEGFSGGEKKRNEILQMILLESELSILDETDSGLDIDALKIISKGINTFMNSDKAIILITHYQRLLDYIKPDYVHVMQNGKIIKTGTSELAKELEIKGYEWLS